MEVRFYFEGGAWCSSLASVADLRGLIAQYGPPTHIEAVGEDEEGEVDRLTLNF